MDRDPVHQDPEDQKWYFWDETWADRVGPYDTELEVRQAFIDYCTNVLGLNS